MPPKTIQTFSHQQNIRIIQKFNCFKKGIPQALQIVNIFMASSDVSPSKLPGLRRIQTIEENIDTVRNLVEEKANFSISFPTSNSNSHPELVNTVERYAARLNKDQFLLL